MQTFKIYYKIKMIRLTLGIRMIVCKLKKSKKKG